MKAGELVKLLSENPEMEVRFSTIEQPCISRPIGEVSVEKLITLEGVQKIIDLVEAEE